jgi:hypothetical protein
LPPLSPCTPHSPMSTSTVLSPLSQQWSVCYSGTATVIQRV